MGHIHVDDEPTGATAGYLLIACGVLLAAVLGWLLGCVR